METARQGFQYTAQYYYKKFHETNCNCQREMTNFNYICKSMPKKSHAFNHQLKVIMMERGGGKKIGQVGKYLFLDQSYLTLLSILSDSQKPI